MLMTKNNVKTIENYHHSKPNQIDVLMKVRKVLIYDSTGQIWENQSKLSLGTAKVVKRRPVKLNITPTAKRSSEILTLQTIILEN